MFQWHLVFKTDKELPKDEMIAVIKVLDEMFPNPELKIYITHRDDVDTKQIKTNLWEHITKARGGK